MTFNSWGFVVFFCVVYGLYLLFHRSFRIQNILLLAASYFFYGYWDYRFLSLLFFSTLMDYGASLFIVKTPSPAGKKNWLLLSLSLNVALLGTFKYFNFFESGLVRLLSLFGFQASFPTLNVLLPVGISFYSFQTMSYVIDVYRGAYPPTSNFVDFALFVSFFPHLVAGPLTRGSSLLPQIKAPRRILPSAVQAALFLIIWGFFKKIVIADNLGAMIVDPIFNQIGDYRGLPLVLAAVGFAVQIYADFSGYTDIGRGLAQLMGFQFPLNFVLPYWAANPQDFWARWHITLSNWFRDYVYLPLIIERSPYSLPYDAACLFLTFFLCGLWHGAAWNFVLWGIYHGLVLAGYRAYQVWVSVNAPNEGKQTSAWSIPLMLVVTLIGWVIFRCRTENQLTSFFSQVSLRASPGSMVLLYRLFLLSLPGVLVEYWQRKRRDLLIVTKASCHVQILFYVALLASMALAGPRRKTEFIYFQF